MKRENRLVFIADDEQLFLQEKDCVEHECLIAIGKISELCDAFANNPPIARSQFDKDIQKIKEAIEKYEEKKQMLK